MSDEPTVFSVDNGRGDGLRVALTAVTPGTMLEAKYRIVRVLGEGGMGAVLLAMDEALAREVAIKVIRPELLARDDIRERFREEARAMARVSHPNVVQVHAFGEHDTTPFFVMELVPGLTLADWLRARDGEIPDLGAAMGFFDQACRGVSAIHAAGTVHHDLKPGNVLVDPTGRVAVSDLGLARALERASGAKRVGGLGGTFAYMAPETALQSEVPLELAARADVYALGCLAYELVTGQTVFGEGNDVAVLSRHLTETPVAPSAVRPELPPALDAAILHALAKDPAERTPTVEHLRRAVSSALAAVTDPEPGRILIVEDDGDFREVLGAYLEATFGDAVVEAAPDGPSALRAYDEAPHDVILLDLQMPGMDGIAVTELIRLRPWAAQTAIVILTASGGPQDWKKLAALGADGFLVKPVNLEDVAALVRRSVRARRGLSLPPAAP